MPQTPDKNARDSSRREGYEVRGAFRPPPVQAAEPGSPVLRVIGGACIVGGISWAAYLITRSSDVLSALEQNHGPVGIIALGVIVSLLGKDLRF